MKQQIIELLKEVLEQLEMYHYEYDPDLGLKVKRQIQTLESDEIHVGWLPTGTVKLECFNGVYKEITERVVEEVRHLSRLQESAEELPYAVRNLNLPDLIELNEHKNFARQDLDDQREKEEQQAREDEELDRLAREEVERSLYGDGIIEDPDLDGGLLG